MTHSHPDPLPPVGEGMSLASAQRIVVKIGSALVVDADEAAPRA